MLIARTITKMDTAMHAKTGDTLFEDFATKSKYKINRNDFN